MTHGAAQPTSERRSSDFVDSKLRDTHLFDPPADSQSLAVRTSRAPSPNGIACEISDGKTRPSRPLWVTKQKHDGPCHLQGADLAHYPALQSTLDATHIATLTPDSRISGQVSATSHELYFDWRTARASDSEEEERNTARRFVLHASTELCIPPPPEPRSRPVAPGDPATQQTPSSSRASVADRGQHHHKKNLSRTISDRDGPGGDEKSDEDGDSGGRPPRKKRRSDGARNWNTLFFACPFVKRDPRRYHRCVHLGLTDFRYVRQHLVSREYHWKPHCPNCKEEFETQEAVDRHQYGGLSCPPDRYTRDGLTNGQKEQLKSRTRIRNNWPEERKWFEAWEVIYPGEPAPASCYISGEMVENGFVNGFSHGLLTSGRERVRMLLMVSGLVSSEAVASSTAEEMLRAALPSSLEEQQRSIDHGHFGVLPGSGHDLRPAQPLPAPSSIPPAGNSSAPLAPVPGSLPTMTPASAAASPSAQFNTSDWVNFELDEPDSEASSFPPNTSMFPAAPAPLDSDDLGQFDQSADIEHPYQGPSGSHPHHPHGSQPYPLALHDPQLFQPQGANNHGSRPPDFQTQQPHASRGRGRGDRRHAS